MARGVIKSDKPKVIVGIDLGTSCGYAAIAFKDGKPTRLESGCWLFDLKQGGGGVQGLRFEHFLMDLVSRHGASLVAFEDVRFKLLSVAAMRVYFGMQRSLMTACARASIKSMGIDVGEVKATMTGMRNGDKEQVAEGVYQVLSYRSNKFDETDAISVALSCAKSIGCWTPGW